MLRSQEKLLVELFSAVTSVRQRAHEKHGVNAVPTLFINEHEPIGNHDRKECEAVFAHHLDRKG